jgi:hypothetical protein
MWIFYHDRGKEKYSMVIYKIKLSQHNESMVSKVKALHNDRINGKEFRIN